MRTFSWLHLTDLHFGMHGLAHAWPNVAEAYFEDLASLQEVCGPWDAVLFTGDLVQGGSKEEFSHLGGGFFQPLWERLAKLGPPPVLLAVPGNHDLHRPDEKALSAAHRMLKLPGNFDDIADEFWSKGDCEYRQVIERAFANYQTWWHANPHGNGVEIKHGLLPGDFSASLESNGLRIGVMGLNVSFLQFRGGDYRGRLTCDVRQAHHASGGNLPAWTNAHDACLLLTHQGVDWLDERGREQIETEINPSGRFAVHLFGHMHEPVLHSASYGAGPVRHRWQGASLFGLEYYGEEKKEKRIHGYVAARMEVEGEQVYMRAWPRRAVRDANGCRFVPDHDSYKLENDQGTGRIHLGKTPRDAGPRPAAERSARLPEVHDSEHARSTLLASYHQALLNRCDIVDLAGLPADDVHLLTAKQFSLRNLFVPLHARVEDAASEASKPSDIEALRLEQRRRDAGRHLRMERRSMERPENTGLHSIGSRLVSARRLLVLGDPGSGKSTLLRWIATAYLLKQAKDPHLDRMPAIDTLPRQDLWPILIRCRDLSPDTLHSVTLEGILRQALAKLELPSSTAQEREQLDTILREQLARGQAILLIDGLDEIMDRNLRARFCEQLELVADQYEQAFVVITSRIVGYREMRRSLVHRFEHLVIADLSPADKDRFIARWCEIIETPERRQWTTRELESAVHGSERIERLTGNPMLLTTLALVKRKVGKLPSRRHELYREAVDVLLYWRPEVGDLLDKEEALPQLQYVAYAMCQDGVQQLRRDQLLSHLEDMRAAYANIRPIHKRSPEEFIALLEERTSLIVQTGEVRHDGEPVPVFEFRHLTFQEYLAALALVQGRFPGHTRTSTLAARVAPLAGRVDARDPEDEDSIAVSEHWHEALRLCVACCNDDDVDDVLRAVFTPMPEEDPLRTSRPRAMLAAWCLADEPHASQEAGEQVLRAFAQQLRGVLRYRGHSKDAQAWDAASALYESVWARSLEYALIDEFIRRAPEQRAVVGGIASIAEVRSMPVDRADMKAWLLERVARLEHGTQDQCVAAALGIMEVACVGRAHPVPHLIETLLALLDRGGAVAHAAAWALAWLHEHADHYGIWHPSGRDISQLLAIVGRPDSDPAALERVFTILNRADISAPIDDCTRVLRHSYVPLASAAAWNLSHTDGDRVREPLLDCLRAPDLDDDVRSVAAYVLGAQAHLPTLHQVLELIDSGDIPGDLGQEFHDGLSGRKTEPIHALEHTDRSAIAELMLGYLQDTRRSASVRRTAVSILGDLGEVRAVEPLLACLSDSSSPELQSDAAVALGRIGDSRALDALVACLQDPTASDDLQDSAAYALGCIDDSSIIEPLLECLERFAPTSIMGMDIFTAMQRGTSDHEIGLRLQEVMQAFSENGNLCAAIVEALGQFQDERIVQPLLVRFTLALLFHTVTRTAEGVHIWLHMSILQQLAELAKIAQPRVAEELLVTLQIRGLDPGNRSAIIHTLGEVGATSAADALRAILQDSAEAPEVRIAAAEVLGRMGQPEAFNLLDRYALEHEDAAATHLPEVEPDKYGTFLGSVVYRGDSYELQRAAVRALSTLGEPRCIEPLMRALRAPSALVRAEALQGLLQMRGDTLDSKLLLGDAPYVSNLLDPRYTVFSRARMRRQARELGLPLEEIQRRYEALARDYDLFIEVPEQDVQPQHVAGPTGH